MLREQVKEYISGLSDPDLVEYVQIGTGLYEPNAVSYAEQELDQRQIDPDRLAELLDEAQCRIAHKKAEAARQAAQPLSSRGKMIAFAAGFFGGWHVILDLIVDHGDEKSRRSQDRRKFMLLGLTTVLFIVMLFAVIWGIFRGGFTSN
jgi:hypothetical protein